MSLLWCLTILWCIADNRLQTALVIAPVFILIFSVESQILGWSINKWVCDSWFREEGKKTKRMLIKPWLLFLATLHNVLDSASLAGYWWLLISPLEIVFLCWFGCHPFTTAPCSASDTPVVTAGNCRLSKNHCNAVVLFPSLVHHHSLRQNVILVNIVMCLFALQEPATNCRSAIHNYRQRVDRGKKWQLKHKPWLL